eukprot:c38887_g1_i1 orf=343-1125(-)
MVLSMGPSFAVLLAGQTLEYVQKKYGGLGCLFVKFLSDPGETWDIFPVIKGHFPTDEELQKYDGFVVTGSRHDAHGGEDWIQKLCQLIQKVHQKRKKLLGICFGHQVLSLALGGKTGRAPVGWEVGLKNVIISDALLSKPYGHKLPPSIRVIEVHQDQVSEIPPGGELLASSEKTGIEIFAVGEHVLGIQGHPEFTEDVLHNFLDTGCHQGLTEELINEAVASMKEGKPDREILQQLCKSFLKGPSYGENHWNYAAIEGA